MLQPLSEPHRRVDPRCLVLVDHLDEVSAADLVAPVRRLEKPLQVEPAGQVLVAPVLAVKSLSLRILVCAAHNIERDWPPS